MLGEGRDPDAQVDRDGLLVDDERLIHGIKDLFRDQHRAGHIGRAPGHDGKLVAAIAGYRVRLAQHATHALAHLLQQPVTGLVAEAVVYTLEPVQVHQEDRTRFHLALAGTDGFLEPLLKERSVGQPGQRIVERLVLQRFGLRLPLRHVAKASDHEALRPEPPNIELHRERRAIFPQASGLVASHFEERLLGPQVGA